MEIELTDEEIKNLIIVEVCNIQQEMNYPENGVELKQIATKLKMDIDMTKNYIQKMGKENSLNIRYEDRKSDKWFIFPSEKTIENIEKLDALPIRETARLLLEKMYDFYKRGGYDSSMQFNTENIGSYIGLINTDKVNSAVELLHGNGLVRDLCVMMGNTIFFISALGINKMEEEDDDEENDDDKEIRQAPIYNKNNREGDCKMSEIKYQIFISSTYEDLKEEREAVIKTILSLYHIPIGMEMFNAGDNDQWTVISKTIETSDYYVVIIGERYGSTTDTGVSYTEKEYDYAVSKGIPVYTFLKDENSPSTPEQKEKDTANQQKLSAFREKAKKKMADFWKTKDELTTKLSISLHKAFTEQPRTGWVRATQNDTHNNGFSEEESIELTKKTIHEEIKPISKTEIDGIMNKVLNDIRYL